MKNYSTILGIISVCMMTGCTIKDIAEGGDYCPPNRTGEISFVQFPSGKCMHDNFATCLGDDSRDAIALKLCPLNAPKCAKDAEDNYYCTQDCSALADGVPKSVCDGQCIDPQTDERYCGATETCESYTTCKANEECQNGQCVCPEGQQCEPTCTADEVKCSDMDGGALKLQCNGQNFDIVGVCPNNASCRDNDCGECQNNTVTCETDETTHKGSLKTCQNGTLESSDCPNDMPCLDNKECAECMTEGTTCQNVDGIGQLKSCLNGKWLISPCANDLPCVDETACAKCPADAPDSCVDDAELNAGVVTRCIEGAYQSETCEFSCSDNACGECMNGTTRCVNHETTGIGQTEICQNGKWQIQTTCNNASCNADGTKCGDCVNTAEVQCIMHDTIGFMVTCINGELKEQTCPGNAECKNGECDKVCTEGTQSCFDGNEYKCINNAIVTESCNGNMCNGDNCGECGEADNSCVNDETTGVGKRTQCVDGKITTQACTDDTSCNAAGECGACNDLMKTVCENASDGGAILMTCQNGALVKTKNLDVSCNADGTAIGECKDGETKCTSGIGMFGKTTYQVCTNGAWVTTACNASCTTDGKCGECKNGTPKCENNTQYTCSNGQWGTPAACAFYGCSSATNKCAECRDGQKKCDTYNYGSYGSGAYVLTCKNGSYMSMNPADPTSYTLCDSGQCNADKTDCAPAE